jgi:hypothetical protein
MPTAYQGGLLWPPYRRFSTNRVRDTRIGMYYSTYVNVGPDDEVIPLRSWVYPLVVLACDGQVHLEFGPWKA